MWIISISCGLLTVAHLHILNLFAYSTEATWMPPDPEIHKLTPDYISDTFELEWYDGGSAFSKETEVVWEMQILRKDPMEEVALKTYQSKVSIMDKLLHWNWTSDVPFNCTTHFIRIRYILAGTKIWSKWSKFVNIPGKDTGSFAGIYPHDRVVLAGSDVTLCCVWKRGENVTSLGFAECQTAKCWVGPLSEWSMLIHMDEVPASPRQGTYGWCLVEDLEMGNSSIYGTVLFFGYPPDIPQRTYCKPRNFEEITCQWEQGRSTKLHGPWGTHYFLSEKFSGKNITCPVAGLKPENYWCNFPVLSDQTIYDFTLQAYNSLGYSKVSVLIEIDREV